MFMGTVYLVWKTHLQYSYQRGKWQSSCIISSSFSITFCSNLIGSRKIKCWHILWQVSVSITFCRKLIGTILLTYFSKFLWFIFGQGRYSRELPFSLYWFGRYNKFIDILICGFCCETSYNYPATTETWSRWLSICFFKSYF